jgi:hypothetical protein
MEERHPKLNLLIPERKTREFYFHHFDEDDTDFDHIYGILVNIANDVLDYKKKDLIKYGTYFYKTPAKIARMEWAEDNLIELTLEQTEFICTVGVLIITRAIKLIELMQNIDTDNGTIRGDKE